MRIQTYITSGKVTSLKHKSRDDSVEARSLVTESLLTSAQSSEVRCGLGRHIIEELEHDLCSRACHMTLTIYRHINFGCGQLPSFTETSKYTSDLALDLVD